MMKEKHRWITEIVLFTKFFSNIGPFIDVLLEFYIFCFIHLSYPIASSHSMHLKLKQTIQQTKSYNAVSLTLTIHFINHI